MDNYKIEISEYGRTYSVYVNGEPVLDDLPKEDIESVTLGELIRYYKEA